MQNFKKINQPQHPWHVKTELFEGPLDVLLALIRAKKKDIVEISLTEICTPFLDYLKTRFSLNIETDSSFIDVASSLLLIKSSSLLPNSKTEDEEQTTTEQEEAAFLEEELKQKLVVHEKIRKLSLLLDAKDRLFREFFPRPKPLSQNTEELIEKQLRQNALAPSVYNFAMAYQNILTHEMHHIKYVVQEKTWDVDKQIELIKNILTTQKVITFFSLCGDLNNKNLIITNLMAVLEITKLKEIKVLQPASFSDFSCIKT